MSPNLPIRCGRIASNSSSPDRPITCSLSADTAKWLAQKCVSRSANGRRAGQRGGDPRTDRGGIIVAHLPADEAPRGLERIVGVVVGFRARLGRAGSSAVPSPAVAAGAAATACGGRALAGATGVVDRDNRPARPRPWSASGHVANAAGLGSKASSWRFSQPFGSPGTLSSGRAPSPKRLSAMLASAMRVSMPMRRSLIRLCRTIIPGVTRGRAQNPSGKSIGPTTSR